MVRNEHPPKKTVSVSWIANRWRVSATTVLRFIEAGTLKAYRLTKRGWWRVSLQSVLEYEEKIARGV
jgi:excisionase family DNA binding protein